MANKRSAYRRILAAIVFLVSSICTAFTSPNANAVSVYDNVIALGEPKIICPNNQVIDLTTSYVSHVLGISSSFDNSLNDALDQGTGWGLTQYVNTIDGTASLLFYARASSSSSTAYFATSSTGSTGVLRSASTKLMVIGCDVSGEIIISNASITANRDMAHDINTYGYEKKPVYLNWPINYPAGYEGIEVSDVMEDMDDDGLNETQEQVQGTLDSSKDTDGDGLDDYIESRWYPDRTSIFCGSLCAYPSPIEKDVYIEVDWMNSPSDGSYQPSNAQLNQVISAFEDRGINVHFDTGQYGGGNELSSYEGILPFAQDSNNFDFYDYKNGTTTTNINFDSDRERIWHYMISGHQYAENTGSSGVSYAGDDDFFVSYGLIKDSQSSFGYTSLDTAIAGTIIHELGHNLCLTNASVYGGQAAECMYGGIDNVSASSDYESSMNYSYQMFMVDYSNGINGVPNDHNDWYAVDVGMKDFSNVDRDAGDVANGVSRANKSKKLIQGITIEKAQDLRKKNKLGKRNLNYFTRQQILTR